MYRLVLFLCLLLAIPVVQCTAQPLPLLHYTAEHGLPSSKVYQVYRDSKGFLWFATDKGCARYNGIRFEQFTTASGLPDNEIFSFKEDHEHRLWIGSYSGDLCYYRDNVFYTAANAPFLNLPEKFAHTERINVEYDSSVTILFTDRQELVNIKHEKVSIVYLHRLDGNNISSGIIQVRKIPGNKYEALYNNKRVIIDRNGNPLQTFTNRNNQQYSYSTTESRDYLLAANGLYTIEEQLLYPIHKLKPGNGYIVSGSDGRNFFLCTPDGLYINDSIQILKGIQLTGMSRDLAGNYWITSLNNGIYYLDRSFLQHTINGGYSGHIKAVWAAGKTMYFITGENTVYEIRNSRATVITSSYDAMKTAANDAEAMRTIRGYFIDTACRGRIPPGYLVQWKDDIYYDAGFIYSIWQKSINLLEFHGNTPHSGQMLFVPKETDGRIFCWAMDNHRRLWFSTKQSVYIFTGGQAHELALFHGRTLRKFIFLNDYLIGYTHTNQLLIYRAGKRPITEIKSQDCVWDKLYAIDDRHILISTDNLYRILTLSDTGYTIHTVENPFVPLQAEYIYSDGESCYFFKDGAIAHFAIQELPEHAAPPKVVFSALTAGNHVCALQPEVTLAYKDARNIHLAYSVVSFSGKDLYCEYSVSGTDKDEWHEIKGEMINLAAPGFGPCIIKLRARTLSSSFSEPAILRLQVIRPFWATWWFFFTAAAALITIVWFTVQFILRYKLSKKQKEYEREIKYRQSEFKALNALMNPHFIFNSLTNIRGLIKGDDKKAADNYLMVFSKMVRQNMENISHELVSLQKELDLITNYLKLEQLRFRTCLNYAIEVDEEVETDDIYIPPLLIQPLVENAIRHGLLPLQSPEALVTVRVYEREDVLYIEVEDNGIGLKQAAGNEDRLHESFAIGNMRQRIGYINRIHKKQMSFTLQELYRADNTVSGTLAVIKMQLSYRL